MGGSVPSISRRARAPGQRVKMAVSPKVRNTGKAPGKTSQAPPSLQPSESAAPPVFGTQTTASYFNSDSKPLDVSLARNFFSSFRKTDPQKQKSFSFDFRPARELAKNDERQPAVSSLRSAAIKSGLLTGGALLGAAFLPAGKSARGMLREAEETGRMPAIHHPNFFGWLSEEEPLNPLIERSDARRLLADVDNSHSFIFPLPHVVAPEYNIYETVPVNFGHTILAANDAFRRDRDASHYKTAASQIHAYFLANQKQIHLSEKAPETVKPAKIVDYRTTINIYGVTDYADVNDIQHLRERGRDIFARDAKIFEDRPFASPLFRMVMASESPHFSNPVKFGESWLFQVEHNSYTLDHLFNDAGKVFTKGVVSKKYNLSVFRSPFQYYDHTDFRYSTFGSRTFIEAEGLIGPEKAVNRILFRRLLGGSLPYWFGTELQKREFFNVNPDRDEVKRLNKQTCFEVSHINSTPILPEKASTDIRDLVRLGAVDADLNPNEPKQLAEYLGRFRPLGDMLPSAPIGRNGGAGLAVIPRKLSFADDTLAGLEELSKLSKSGKFMRGFGPAALTATLGFGLIAAAFKESHARTLEPYGGPKTSAARGEFGLKTGEAIVYGGEPFLKGVALARGIWSGLNTAKPVLAGSGETAGSSVAMPAFIGWELTSPIFRDQIRQVEENKKTGRRALFDSTINLSDTWDSYYANATKNYFVTLPNRLPSYHNTNAVDDQAYRGGQIDKGEHLARRFDNIFVNIPVLDLIPGSISGILGSETRGTFWLSDKFKQLHHWWDGDSGK
jgi:hypothetical protein